jgi:hypothetical protein
LSARRVISRITDSVNKRVLEERSVGMTLRDYRAQSQSSRARVRATTHNLFVR